jgi:two-component system chemotaxis response regulator CheY
MVKLNVMIVDDSLIAVRKLEAMLATLGHEVVSKVATGGGAVNAYQRCNPDLVTMDITMPDMDGIQATREIIKTYADANIIMVTSHGQEGMVREALKAGAKGYVLKPVDPQKLADMINKVMGL